MSSIKNWRFGRVAYSIEAIKNCAIGYVVKPIDNDEFKQDINNVLKSIKQKTATIIRFEGIDGYTDLCMKRWAFKSTSLSVYYILCLYALTLV